MNKNLKKLLKAIEKECGEEDPTVKAIKFFHRRLAAASLVAEDVLGEKVTDAGELIKLYDYLLKEEAAVIYVNSYQETKKAAESKSKESVIAEAPQVAFLPMGPPKEFN